MTIESLFGGNSTKEKIIELLSKNWPLSAKKIYNQLQKEYHISITYQATHKALKELFESKVLERQKEGYLLNKEWAKKLESFSGKIKNELEQENNNREIKTIQKLKFDTHREFIKYQIDLMEDILKKEKKLEVVFHYRHMPYPHVMSSEEIKRMKQIMPKLKWTIKSRKDTPMGRWCAKQWEKMGIKTEVGTDISADRMMFLNDYILLIYTSKESLKEWDKSYSVKSIDEYNINETMENISSPMYKTIMLVMKDKELANMLR